MSKILFVDDDPVFLQLLRCYFAREGAFFVSNPWEARQCIIRHEPFETVITDLQMPGETGFSLAQFVHEQFAGTNIFLLSSYTPEEGIPPYIQRFISKPIELQKLDFYIRAVEKT